MTITVKHKFVSAIPDEADATVVRPSNWNDDHQLTGVIDVANGGTGAATLTGYVKGSGTSAMTASTTIPSGDVSGLGTMATQNANAVAITGGTVNGTTIGATTASTGAFTYASTNSTTSTTPTLSFNGSNTSFASGSTVANNYLQAILQNKSGTAGASTNYVLSNDLGTDSSYYGEFGMNSSVYSSGTPADFFSLNNGVYYSGHDGDISIGSGNGYKTYLAWGTTGDKAHVINASGALGLNTNITGTTNFGTSGQVLTSAGSSATPTWSSTISPSQVLINQSYDQGTGVLQVTGQSTFNGTVTDKSLNLQGGNNLFKYSQGNFSLTSYWQQSGSPVIVDNNNVAPDGTTTASQITANTANSVIQVLSGTTVSANTATYTQTIYAKRANSGTTIRFDLRDTTNNYAYTFNLSTLAITALAAVATSATITTLPNSWCRLQITAPNATSGTVLSTLLYIPTSGDSFYIWGAQLELGTVASAYTPTTTVAVTTTNNISVPSGQVLASSSTSRTLPAISFLGNANYGFNVNTANGGIDINPTGDTYYSATSTGNLGFNIGYSFPLSWTATRAGSGQDLMLYRDAANTLAQRNSTNAQTFRLYNTYTSTSLGEWLSVDWSTTANTATIATKANGAGVVRTLATGNPLVISTGYTVATLPTGVVGMRAYVTNALAPTYATTVVGGGAVTIPVFYNGTAWICA